MLKSKNGVCTFVVGPMWKPVPRKVPPIPLTPAVASQLKLTPVPTVTGPTFASAFTSDTSAPIEFCKPYSACAEALKADAFIPTFETPALHSKALASIITK